MPTLLMNKLCSACQTFQIFNTWVIKLKTSQLIAKKIFLDAKKIPNFIFDRDNFTRFCIINYKPTNNSFIENIL